MSGQSATTSARRGFLVRLAGGVAALAAGWSITHAEPIRAAAPLPGADDPDAWTARITGKHRQVVDAVSPNSGFAAAYAANFADGYKTTHNLTDRDITPVIVFRHMAMPLALQDAVWAKYHIGELLQVNDPKTSAPATRNIFRDSIALHPGLTYEQMMRSGTIILACNLALSVFSSMAAPKAGVEPDEAKKEWQAGLIPGVVLVPSGVYAVSRAQERECTYCFGG
ncbi:MAG TPA: hypothetical protein VFS05_02300 [Gemmatimonadaceae bacterium]|nr:hypothetical protein [Gemmatimonadaceae bacterium]